MTDTEKPPSLNQFPVPSPIALQFPTIPVNESLVEWLAQSDSFNMRSKQTERRYDHTVVPMEDSFYGIVEPCATASDDEASNNSAFSSYEEETEDEGNVFTNDRSAITVKGKEPDLSHPFSDLEQGHATLEGHPQSNDVVSAHYNDKSTQRTMLSRETDTRYLTLNEMSSNMATGLVDAACSIHSIRGDWITNTSAKVGQAKCSESTIIGGILGQTMVREPMKLPKPYTVLYVGETSSKDSIMEKIGSAIAASERVFDPSSGNAPPSDFSIHPVSSSADGTCSNALLVPSTGFTLSTQECRYARVVSDGKTSGELHLRSSDTTLVIPVLDIGRWTPPNNWKRPDLTIFCIPRDDDKPAQEARRFVRFLMNRLSVPCILITQTAPPENMQELFDIDLHTPHFSLNCSTPGLTSRYVRKQPIDLVTFLELDASQMNRNLACLARFHRKPSLQVGTSWEEGNTRKNAGILVSAIRAKYVRSFPHIFTRPNPATLISTMIILFTLGAYWQLSGPFRAPSAVRDIARPAASTAGGSIVTAYSTLTTSTISKTSATQLPFSIQAPAHKSVAIVHSDADLAYLLLDPKYSVRNNSENFQVHVIGDSHILIRPPQWLVRSRKSPKLFFNVTRGVTLLKHSVSTPFDGVIALKLKCKDAHSKVNVTLWTNSKPRLNETFQVNFGTRWLNIAGCKKIGSAVTESIREDLGAFQKGLSLVYDRTSLELQSFVQDAVRRAQILRKEAKKIGTASINQTTRTTDLVLAQTTGFTHKVVKKLRNRNAHTQIDRLCKDMAIYRSQMISRLASRAHRAKYALNSRMFANRLRARRASTIRNTQKRAIKLWWKVVGLPNKNFEKCTLCKPPLKTYRTAKKGHKR